MTAHVAYECEICANEAPEVAWRSDVNDMAIAPGGRQICEACWDSFSALDWPDWEDRRIPKPLYLAEENPETVADRMDALREALTPSCDTKAAYMGEFYFSLPDFDERGNEIEYRINVPWTTIKDIMAAIRTRATEALTQAGYSPSECAGKGSCPQNYACTE